MSLESVFANPPPPLVGEANKETGMEDNESDEYDDSPPVLTPEANGSENVEEQEESSDAEAAGEEILEDQNDTQEVDDGMETSEVGEAASAEEEEEDQAETQEVQDPEDLEEGELEEGEIDDEGEVPAEETGAVEADPEPQEKEEDSNDGAEENADGSPEQASDSDSVEEEKLSRKEKRKRKKEKKRKRREEREKKKKKKKHPKYIDHDHVEDEFSSQKGPGVGWPGYAGHSPYKSSPSHGRSPPGPYDSPEEREESQKGKDRERPQPERSPPGPYDSPYESPPGPYDSPSEDEEYGPPPSKMHRYDGKKSSMLSMLGDEYMDPNVVVNDKQELFKRGMMGRKRKMEKSKKYMEMQQSKASKKRALLETPKTKPFCKFFMEGKCNRGPECPFNHDFRPPKKAEVCKFYLNNSCAKGADCLYMHGEYPCKYFHTGKECFQGENCKFSHDELTDETRPLLEKILSEGTRGPEDEENDGDYGSPQKGNRPSLLGSPPRHLREQAERMKKIPSLFDIQVFPPGQGPPPPPPPPRFPGMPPPGGPGIPPPGPLPPMLSPQPGAPRPNFYAETGSPARPPPPLGQPPPGVIPGGPPPGASASAAQAAQNFFTTLFNAAQQKPSTQPAEDIKSPDHEPAILSNPDQGLVQAEGTGEPINADGGSQDEKVMPSYEIPAHLPPKQRELFLRIQQQQRSAIPETMQGSQDKEDEDDNWYSSDEEESDNPQPKLTDIIKTLNHPPQQAGVPPVPQPQVPPQPKFDIASMLNAIRMQSGASAQGNGSQGAGAKVQVTRNATRDPRAAMVHSNSDPRSAASASKVDPRLARQANVSDSARSPGEEDQQLSGETRPDSSVQEGEVKHNVASSASQIPYTLYSITTDRKPLINIPPKISTSDPRLPHLKRQLSQTDPRVSRQDSDDRNKEKPQAVAAVPTGGAKISDPRMQRAPGSLANGSSGAPKPFDPRLQRAVSADPRLQKIDNMSTPKLGDPRAGKSHSDAGRSQDPRMQGPHGKDPLSKVADPRLIRTMSAPHGVSGGPEKPADPRQTKLGPPEMPEALRSRPSDPRAPPEMPDALKMRPSDPRYMKTPEMPVALMMRPEDPRSGKVLSNNSSSAESEKTNKADKPLGSHRYDPRFKIKPKKANSASSDTGGVLEQRKKNLEYSSPLGGDTNANKDSSSNSYSAYNKPPNSSHQQKNQNNRNQHGNNQNHRTVGNSGGNGGPGPRVDPRMPPVHIPPPGMPGLPLLPEQMMQPPQQLIQQPEPASLKDVFKTIDPTASPFC